MHAYPVCAIGSIQTHFFLALPVSWGYHIKPAKLPTNYIGETTSYNHSSRRSCKNKRTGFLLFYHI